MDDKTYLLTGLPRSGTTLCCHILNTCPNTLALHEPLSPQDFDAAKGAQSAVQKISDFACQTRSTVHNDGLAISRQRDGKVPDNPVAQQVSDNGLRANAVTLGAMDVSAQQLTPDFNLIVKHNALFTALLPELKQTYPMYAVIRNPLAVLASWNSVDLPVNRGRIPAGEKYSADLQRQLDAEPDRLARQLIILEWFFSRFATHVKPEKVLRYEHFVKTASVVPEVLGLSLANGNLNDASERQSRNSTYDVALMAELYQGLKGYGEAIWQFYSKDDIEQLYQEITSAS